MKSKWLTERAKYDGTQLRGLFCYLEHSLLGDAIVAWRGPCDISFAHMVDGEDLLEKSAIRGLDMIHFVMEVFAQELLAGVALQRLMTNVVREVILDLSRKSQGVSAVKAENRAEIVPEILRSGDDLYFREGKLSISIATKTSNSLLIHFAVNVSNDGTPVKTASLQDLKLEPETFAKEVLQRFSQEMITIREATWKVRTF